MKIQSQNVELSAYSQSFKSYSLQEEINVRIGPPVQQVQVPKEAEPFKLDLSQNAINLQEAASAENAAPAFELSDEDKAKIRLIERFIEILTGKKHRIRILDKIRLDTPEQIAVFNGDKNASQPKQWAVSYQKTEQYYESQQMNFNAGGKVKTADGREIEFSLDLSMSSEMFQSSNISLRAGNFADPLMINLDGSIPELTKEKYSFDITIDGKNESISMPVKGQGLLSIDKNGDGVINDGSELFGASTGDGFAELAIYDSDSNGWIDENDQIFSELKIMIKESASADPTLKSLTEAGVGAIYLGSVNSPYELKNSTNQTSGIIRKSGFYLHENGSAGLIQHVDFSY